MKSSSDLKYNMVHFSPIQKRGMSNSPYSIYDQLEISDDIFQLATSRDEKDSQMKALIKNMEHNLNMYSIVDVVWNHTANNSAWLIDHPESGYNLDNSPHLKVAYDLDEAILKFSITLSEYNLDPNIRTEEDLTKMVDTFMKQHLPKYRLWEYFVINIDDTIKEAKSHKDNQGFKDRMSLEQAVEHLKAHGIFQTKDKGRFSRKVDLNVLAFILKSHFQTKLLDWNVDQVKFATNALEIANLEFYRKLDDDLKTISNNMIDRAKYERLAPHGPKLGTITSE
jgi:glycogen debranching enzyme